MDKSAISFRNVTGADFKKFTDKKLVAFDLDGTLTRSKAPLEAKMATVLHRLLKRKKVAVVSGGAKKQYEKQFLSNLGLSPEDTANLFLFPTNGSAFYSFEKGSLTQRYAENFTPEQKQKILSAIQAAFKKTDFTPDPHTYGELIEDRDSQITFSGLGQEAPVELKKAWDPDRTKREPIKAVLDELLPDFEIKINSSSSIDITKKGIDKAYAIRKICENLDLKIGDILFVGDALFPGGNDSAVLRTGIDAVEVTGPEETVELINRILA